MNEDEIDQLVAPLLTAREEYGIGRGLERAADYLIKQAIDYFSKHQDDTASLLRDLSNHFHAAAEEQTNIFSKMRKEQDTAWEAIALAVNKK